MRFFFCRVYNLWSGLLNSNLGVSLCDWNHRALKQKINQHLFVTRFCTKVTLFTTTTAMFMITATHSLQINILDVFLSYSAIFEQQRQRCWDTCTGGLKRSVPKWQNLYSTIQYNTIQYNTIQYNGEELHIALKTYKIFSLQTFVFFTDRFCWLHCQVPRRALEIPLYTWAATWQNQKNGRAPSEDQPGHPPILIRVFAVRMKKAWVLSYLLSAQRRLIRLSGCPGWSESSLGAHLFCWFCHVAAHLRSEMDNIHIFQTAIHNMCLLWGILISHQDK